MLRFGDYLKQARESAGVPLEHISAVTHISVRLLEALEQERFDILPGGVFTVNFARQYARLVGLDEDETVSRLKQVAPPVEVVLEEWKTQRTRTDDTAAKLAEFFTDILRRYRTTLTGGAATLVLLAGGLVFFQAYEDGETELASRQPLPQARQAFHEATAPTPSEAVSVPSYEPPAQPAPQPEAHPVEVSHVGNAGETPAEDPSKSIQLELRLTDRAWVRVVADGERVLEANLEPGFVQTIQAQQSVQLFVGNAGGVKVALNGETMQPLGPPGHVRRVDVSAAGMEVVDIQPTPGEQTASGARI
jgi:cytoskeleton protein RodZ